MLKQQPFKHYIKKFLNMLNKPKKNSVWAKVHIMVQVHLNQNNQKGALMEEKNLLWECHSEKPILQQPLLYSVCCYISILINQKISHSKTVPTIHL